MQTRVFSLIFCGVVFALTLALIPYSAQAQQPEPEVDCAAATEPIPLNFKEHTANCDISPASDVDTFTFVANQNDTIRVIVDGTAIFDPRLEIIGPSGPPALEDQFCSSGCCPSSCSVSVDTTLPEDGTYTLIISDQGTDEEGTYVLQLERNAPPIGQK